MNKNTQPQRNFEDYVFYAEKTGDNGLMPIPANAFTQCPGKPGQSGIRSFDLDENAYAGPASRAYAVLAYDSSRKVVVLFGGTGSSSYNDTWEWNGKQWTQITTFASPPINSPDGPPCIAYDATNNEIVLFTYPGETWTYNGSNWIQKSPVTSPATRDGAGMAYDPIREKIVMFGGYDISGSPIYYDETWEWDGTNWSQISPATSPSSRWGVSMAYDGNGIMLFGGQDSIGNNLDETWRWDGTNWTQLAPATSPPVRVSAAITTYADDNVLLHGGDDFGALTDTWLWNGMTWTNQNPSHQPSARTSFWMSYDIEKNEVILFGGYSSPSYLNDTWKWIGNDWIKTAVYTEKHIIVNLPFSFNFCGVDYKQIAIGIDGDAILIDPADNVTYNEGEPFIAEGTVFNSRNGDIKYDATNSNVKQTFLLNKKHVVLMPWADEYTTSYNNFDQYSSGDPDEFGDAYYAITSTEIADLKNGLPPYISNVNGVDLAEYKVDETDYAVRYCTTNTPEGPAFVVRWNVIAGHSFDI